MKIIKGGNKVPVIYTAHHASHDFREFSSRVLLTTEQKVRFSDYGTDITVPQNGIATLIAQHSRALGDLNRDPDDPERFQIKDYARPERHPIWNSGQELSAIDKLFCQENYYDPFHNEIVNLLKKRNELTFVVAWDNTAHYVIGEDKAGNLIEMKPIILSNRGHEGSSDSVDDEQTSCDPKFLTIFARILALELEKRGLPNEIKLNLVFRGGYICRTYSSLRNSKLLKDLGVNCEVQSFQIEYDTLITHDQDTLEPRQEKIYALRDAFSVAIEQTYSEYIKNIQKN